MPHVQIKMARREAERKSTDPLVVDGFFGESFTCRPSLNQWTLLEMLASDKEDTNEVASAFMAFLEEMIVPDDWNRFRQTCRLNRVTAVDLQPLVTAVSEHYAATPTQPSSDSSVGSSPTGKSSRAASSSAGKAQGS